MENRIPQCVASCPVAGGQDIFFSDNDRALFLSLLQELPERYNIQIHAYVLMGNHYHLLVKTIEPNLSMAMQWLGTSYTRKFNLANQTGGHLFQGRFKSIIVQNDAYLLRLSCYIHRNPLRAGIVEKFVDDIKNRFLGDNKDAALPQYNSLLRAFDPELLLGKASKFLGFDINAARNARKIVPEDKVNRDMLVYLIWQSGRLSNKAIGEYFGITYSSVSKCVKTIADKLSTDNELKARYYDLKSQFKL